MACFKGGFASDAVKFAVDVRAIACIGCCSAGRRPPIAARLASAEVTIAASDTSEVTAVGATGFPS